MRLTLVICLFTIASCLSQAEKKFDSEVLDSSEFLASHGNENSKDFPSKDGLDSDGLEKDNDVSKFSTKKHPKGTAGSVTEIKPARGGAKEISDKKKIIAASDIEDAPPYMKEDGSVVDQKEKLPKIVEEVQPVKSKAEEKLENEGKGDFNSFVMAVSMIVVSEIGDKTFLIAALMAMRSPRLVVFSAAASALVIMTILSGVVGHALPALIPQHVTQFLASGLFVVFGYKLLREGMEMSNEVGVSGEMAEVEEEIALSSINSKNDHVEAGPSSAYRDKMGKSYLNQFKQVLSLVLSPTWIQVFVMTFLGEWGDRSQIATIAMAAGSDYWFVILGGCVGHTFCTAIAVLGGMFLASRISMKQITLGGAATFFLFALLYLYEAIWGDH